MLSVDVVIPCRNEASYIHEMLKTVFEQDYPKQFLNVFVVDGNSRDGTKEILEGLSREIENLHVLDNPAGTTPHALNIGIRAGSADLVIRMDCHAVYPQNYISYLVNNLVSLNADNVGVCVETLPADDSATAQGIALALSSPMGVGGSVFRTGTKVIRRADTVPFGCFKRSIFEKVGLFDQQLVRNQDDEFNSRIIKNGGQIYLLPDVKIKYFARSSFSKLGQMYFQYGVFKPLSNLKSGRVVSLRQFAPSALILSLLSTGFGAALYWPLGVVFLAILFFYQIFLLAYGFWDFYLKRRVGISATLRGVWAASVIHFTYGWGFIVGTLRMMFGVSLGEIKLSR